MSNQSGDSIRGHYDPLNVLSKWRLKRLALWLAVIAFVYILSKDIISVATVTLVGILIEILIAQLQILWGISTTVELLKAKAISDKDHRALDLMRGLDLITYENEQLIYRMHGVHDQRVKNLKEMF